MQVPLGIPQAHTRVAVAFDPAFDKNEKIGPDGLGAGIATPHATKGRGEQKQPQPRHDQKARDEIELVRPDLDPEEVETPAGQIDQHRLIGQVRSAIPADPRRQIVNRKGNGHDPPLEGAELARDSAGKDGLSRSIEARGRLIAHFTRVLFVNFPLHRAGERQAN